MTRKFVWYVFILLSLNAILHAEDSWLIPVDDDRYRRAEEFFINAGVVPPYEELPLAAEDLKTQLRQLLTGKTANDQSAALSTFIDAITLPFPVASPILELALSGGYDSRTGRFQNVPLLDGGAGGTADNGLPMTHFPAWYESTAVPSLVTTGLLLQTAGFSLVFRPELRETNVGLLDDNNFISFPESFDRLDISNPIPRYGMISYYSPHFDARLGRSKLRSGPGEFSSLSLAKTMPYFDHARMRVRMDGVSFSATVVSLYPVISAMESDYLDFLYANNQNPEPGAVAGTKISKERIKNYINLNLVFRPWSWLSFSITQTNLVGGRPLGLADFNPFVSLANLADESFHCPLLLSSTVVPLPGVKLYAEFLFYDPNPPAWALMGGFTLLSDHFFRLGPGRFRLNAEITYVDPYAYGNYNDLIKFTSRFMYLEQGAPGAARYWVDYPLGFYLGPDCLDIHAALSYGIADDWEITLEWQTTGRGEVDLYGYGDDSDYLNHPVNGPAPTGTPEWTHSLTAQYYFKPLGNLTLTCWYRIMFIYNRFNPQTRTNVSGDNLTLHSVGLSAVWKIY